MIQATPVLGIPDQQIDVNLNKIGGYSIGFKAIPIIIVEPR